MPGVKRFMSPGGKSKPGINYPLWIIAISLLVIAVCMVLNSIERRKSVRDIDGSRSAAISSPEPEPVADRPGVRVAMRARRTPSTEAPAENSQPGNPTPTDTATSQVAGIPSERSDVGGPQPVGYSVSGIPQGSNLLGEVTGRITLKGTPPPEMILSADPICSKKRSGPIMTRTFVLGESNGLANAVVFLKVGIDATSIPAPTNGVTVLLTNCEIQPYVTAITANQLVNFRDRDGTEHVLGFGDLRPLLLVPENAEQQYRFIRPRLFVPVKCRRHPWETAFICVLENPYFAVTDGNGNFDIPNVPPGTYTIEVAHQGATGTNGVTRSVIVVAGKTAKLNLALNVPRNGPLPPVQARNSSARN